MRRLVACSFCVAFVLMGCPPGQGGDSQLVGSWEGTITLTLEGNVTTIRVTKTFSSSGAYLMSVDSAEQLHLISGTYEADPETGRLTTHTTASSPSSPNLHGTSEYDYAIAGDMLTTWTRDSEQHYTRLTKSPRTGG